MIKNYIKLAWRNMVKYPLYTGIILFGLSIGLTFSLLIGVYVWQELQVNKEIKNLKRQCILTSSYKKQNMGADFITVAPLAQKLKEEYPHLVESFFRWDGISTRVQKNGTFIEESLQIGDPSLLEMFGFKLVFGNPKTAFSKPFSVVITEGIALKYFGKKEVVNQLLIMTNFSGKKQGFTVTGVLKNLPENTVTQINRFNHNQIFVSIKDLDFFGRRSFDSWLNGIIPSYITLKEGINPEELKNPILHILNTHASQDIKNNLIIKPITLTQYHLNTNNGLVKKTLFTLSIIGFFILLMAIVNYVNLAISRASDRIRETGIRKVLGASIKEIKFQFITESVLVVLLSLGFAFVWYPLVRPLFIQIIGKNIPSLSQIPTSFILLEFGLVVIISATSGFYPAFLISSKKTVESLKGKFIDAKSGQSFRKYLVGFQFGIAFILLISTMIITQQINYFLNENLGYNKDEVITVPVPRNWTPEGVQKMEALRDQFIEIPNVEDVSLSYVIPDGQSGFRFPFRKKGTNPENFITANGLEVGSHFLNTYEIQLLAGEFFNLQTAQKDEIVINKTALTSMGMEIPQEGIGKFIEMDWGDTIVTSKIIGVIEDFHFDSKHKPMEPLALLNVKFYPSFRYLTFRLNGRNTMRDLTILEQKWKEIMPEAPFEFRFMNETLAQLYTKEIQLKKALNTGAIIALILIIIGVFGMVSINIKKRQKEVGIRKILGASQHKISMIFFKEFLSIFLIATIISSPLVFGFMDKWLNNFAYKINISPIVFLGAFGTILLLVFLIVKFQTLAIANLNPAQSLKTD